MAKESKITTELLRLANEHGGLLTPAVVVASARDEESPLHNSFEWDDSEAAQAYREHQARQLIRVVAREEKVGGANVSHRVFVSLVSDRKEGGDGYRLVTTVMNDETLRAQMLADARAEMVRFQTKYRDLEELAEVFTAMNAVIETETAEPALQLESEPASP